MFNEANPDPDAPKRYRVCGTNPLQLTGGAEVKPGDEFDSTQTRPELLEFWIRIEGATEVVE